MSNGSKIGLAVALVLITLVGGLILMQSSQSTSTDGVTAVGPGHAEGERIAGGGDLVRSPGQAGPGGAIVRGIPGPNSGQATAEDTGDPDGGDDTGLTREGMIDEMLDDVANDTGMSDEGRARMADALLRARDGAPPEEAPQ